MSLLDALAAAPVKDNTNDDDNNDDDDDDDGDYTQTVDLPALPPKPESILDQMRAVAASNVANLNYSAGTIARINANALVNVEAPPPEYAEFDDE